MERYIIIAKDNLKMYLLPYVFVTIGLCVLSPLFLGIQNLDGMQTAKIIELILSLFGIILLVPLFMADEDLSIRELCQSKREPMSVIHVIRFIEAFGIMSLIITIYLLYLKMNYCQFPYGAYWYAAISNAIFLGGLGIFIDGVLDRMPVAYMIPILYYIACFGSGKKYLGKFYLFSLMTNGIKDKIYLLFGGIIMIILGIVSRNLNKTINLNIVRKSYHIS